MGIEKKVNLIFGIALVVCIISIVVSAFLYAAGGFVVWHFIQKIW